MLITNISVVFKLLSADVDQGSQYSWIFEIFSRALGNPLKINFFINSLKTPSINLFEGLKSMCLDHFLTANADCKLINKTKAV